MEQKLKNIDIKSFSTFDFLKFCFSRKSFFRDYNNLRSKDEDEVKERVKIIIEYIGSDRLYSELLLCYKAAILSEKRHTYYFNLYIIELLELYYSELSFICKSEEIKTDMLSISYQPYISYEWVLYSKILNPYQRYLLFEYLTLGYSIQDLASRRYCDSRTIYNHFNTIIDILSS